MKLTLVKGHHDVHGVSTSSNPSKIIAADGTVLATFLDHTEAEEYYSRKQVDLQNTLYQTGQRVFYKLYSFDKVTRHMGIVQCQQLATNGQGKKMFLYTIAVASPKHFDLYWENELEAVRDGQNQSAK